MNSTFVYEEKHTLVAGVKLLVSVSRFDDRDPVGTLVLHQLNQHTTLYESSYPEANTPEGLAKAILMLQAQAASELHSWAEKIIPRGTVSEFTKDTISQLMHKYSLIEGNSLAAYTNKNNTKKEDYYGGP
jgi:hypothetical protein